MFSVCLSVCLFTQTNVRRCQPDVRHCDECDGGKSEWLCAQHVHVSARPFLTGTNLWEVAASITTQVHLCFTIRLCPSVQSNALFGILQTKRIYLK